jgi:hypothetical protein
MGSILCISSVKYPSYTAAAYISVGYYFILTHSVSKPVYSLMLARDTIDLLPFVAI